MSLCAFWATQQTPQLRQAERMRVEIDSALCYRAFVLFLQLLLSKPLTLVCPHYLWQTRPKTWPAHFSPSHVALPGDTFHCIMWWIVWDKHLWADFSMFHLKFVAELNFHTQGWVQQMQLARKSLLFNSVWHFSLWAIIAMHLNII